DTVHLNRVNPIDHKSPKTSRMKKLYLICAFAWMSIGMLVAQSNVTGKVSDARGEALIGASVTVKGTSTGTITDFNGNYELSVPTADAVLVFTYTGYVLQEVAVSGRSSVDVTMLEDVRLLDEFVVVGYGVQRKSDVTGSISSVKGDAVANLASPSFVQQLAGSAAGVQIKNTYGILGSPPQIRIRGVNSISSGTQPLVVVDGVPVFTGNTGGFTPANALGDINPNDIESYEILKDGAATAIYGSRAANGVLLITTK